MIDPAKTYRTRDGREVRIYAVDGEGVYPVHGSILEDGLWCPNQWKPDGNFTLSGGSHPSDLIEVKHKHVWWVNMYSNQAVGYFSKEKADLMASASRLACIRIEFEEGEGL